ncbi:hypothetical protein F2Q69_00053625 [Brassica cretica]|uniref:Uncharacterized protein n=1 Tax=Brassica cretica TaxID=69181 RepID=A0A8S9N308_BRACR|nr:hypothetical protein F2Q69_00053625 [Brassica cretica]
MTESLQISRKRMRFSSSSASETLLASKSQYHRHRSGRIEPTGDGLRFSQSPSVTGKITPKVLRTYPRVTIKDLRLRRVFTPSSIWEFKTKEQQSENHLCDSNVAVREGVGNSADILTASDRRICDSCRIVTAI